MNTITNFENYSGTIFDRDGASRSRKSIFVSLTSYRDPNVINTIKSMVRNAARPENIYISVAVATFWNHEKWYMDVQDLKYTESANMIFKSFEVADVKTLGELKRVADSSYNKEDYYLSVSSSTEFDPNWDDILIKQFEDISSIKKSRKIVFTASPRGFLNHDDVVDGYVFYTNHKTKVSLQREEYDGSYIPICGYNEFIKESNLYNEVGDSPVEESELWETQEEVRQTKINEQFLKDYGFPKFGSRKFRNDEYIASSLGLSSRFVFGSGRELVKDISHELDYIDEEDWEFSSFLSLLRHNYTILTVRFTPVYHLYEGSALLSEIRKSPKDFYEGKTIVETPQYNHIIRLIDNLANAEPEDRVRMDYLISVDWDEKKFKLRTMQVNDNLVSAINSFVSLYNFSTNENTLHWNKKWPQKR